MKVKSIVHIKGIGKYSNFVSKQVGKWDGNLARCVAVYAENGSGKTTLTQIFKSLSSVSDIEDLRKRKTFNFAGSPSIKLVIEGVKGTVDFDGANWSKELGDVVEVFDSYFIDDNVYVISLNDRKKARYDFQVILGEDAALYKELEELKLQRNRLSGTKGALIRKRKNYSTNDKRYAELTSQIEQQRERITNIKEQILKLEKEISQQTENSQYLSTINELLDIFSPNLHLTALNRKYNNVFVYGLRIGDHEIRTNSHQSPDISLRRILSEGEKNALALSFFLAKLKLMTDLSNQLVVFDDPISSMDASRRQATLNQLSIISEKVSQFILLSHDKLFVRDFSRRNQDTLTLKISAGHESSYINTYDVVSDTQIGITKDILVLQQYVKLCDESPYGPRDVVRCIRPVIEGFLRLKYCNDENIASRKMLGQIIQEIDKATTGPLVLQKPNIETLREINAYSQQYHHSNPNCLETPINEAELRVYCKRTLELLSKL